MGTGARTVATETKGWRKGCECLTEGQEPARAVILDPFGGSGTTGAVALDLGRDAVMIELNPEYIKIMERRCQVTYGLRLAG